MVNTVNKIPSINLPLTNEQGVIHPIWYEFLRSFISSVGDAGGGSGADNTVVAGAGIVGSGNVSTVNVGQGEGISVNANDVAVNITGQINAQAAGEDEILISDASDQSRIRKTSLRDVAALSPGTFPGNNNLSVQYNNNGVFGGDDFFTTDGLGNVDITGSLDIDSININGSSFITANSSTPMQFFVPSGGLNQFLFSQSGAGSSGFTASFEGLGASAGILIRGSKNSGNGASFVGFATGSGPVSWGIGLVPTDSNNFVMAQNTAFATDKIYTVSSSDKSFYHDSRLKRLTTAGITASTVQAQGLGPLTADVNQINTCANINDTVTLPVAQAGSIIYVINDGAQTLQIFPASGDDLGAGLNNSTVLAAGSAAMFVAYNVTNWKQFI